MIGVGVAVYGLESVAVSYFLSLVLRGRHFPENRTVCGHVLHMFFLCMCLFVVIMTSSKEAPRAGRGRWGEGEEDEGLAVNE